MDATNGMQIVLRGRKRERAKEATALARFLAESGLSPEVASERGLERITLPNRTCRQAVDLMEQYLRWPTRIRTWEAVPHIQGTLTYSCNPT